MKSRNSDNRWKPGRQAPRQLRDIAATTVLWIEIALLGLLAVWGHAATVTWICAAAIALHLAVLSWRRERHISALEQQLNAGNAQLDFHNSHDLLTGLYNLDSFDNLLRAAVQRPQQETFTLLHINLNGFREISDSFGHEIGDEVLAKFASRLRKSFRGEDVIARLGQDNFAVILRHAYSGEHIASALCKFFRAIKAPLQTAAGEIDLSARVGAVIWPQHSCDVDELQRMAKLAANECKRYCNPYQVWEPLESSVTVLPIRRRGAANITPFPSLAGEPLVVVQKSIGNSLD